MTEIRNLSISSVEHNGVEFPQRYEPRCLTCRHEDRILIENWWMEGLRGRQILARLGEEPGINERNISDHMNNGHGRTKSLDRMLQRAADQGVTLETYEQNQRAELFVTELVVDKFRARLADEEFQPDFKDGLAAIKLLHELTGGGQGDGFGANEVFVILSTFLNHTKTVLTRYVPAEADAAMKALGTLFEQDPVLRQIVENSQKEQPSSMLDEHDDDYYAEAEIVDEEVVVDNLEVTVVEPPVEDTPFDEPDEEW